MFKKFSRTNRNKDKIEEKNCDEWQLCVLHYETIHRKMISFNKPDS